MILDRRDLAVTALAVGLMCVSVGGIMLEVALNRLRRRVENLESDLPTVCEGCGMGRDPLSLKVGHTIHASGCEHGWPPHKSLPP